MKLLLLKSDFFLLHLTYKGYVQVCKDPTMILIIIVINPLFLFDFNYSHFNHLINCFVNFDFFLKFIQTLLFSHLLPTYPTSFFIIFIVAQ